SRSPGHRGGVHDRNADRRCAVHVAQSEVADRGDGMSELTVTPSAAPGGTAVAAAVAAPPAQWRLLLRKPTFIIGAGILLLWLLCALFGHFFAPFDPLAQQLLAKNSGPSGAHLFGTDNLGRDVLSRVIVGAR